MDERVPLFPRLRRAAGEILLAAVLSGGFAGLGTFIHEGDKREEAAVAQVEHDVRDTRATIQQIQAAYHPPHVEPGPAGGCVCAARALAAKPVFVRCDLGPECGAE